MLSLFSKKCKYATPFFCLSNEPFQNQNSTNRCLKSQSCFLLLPSTVVISCVRSCVWQRKVQSRSTTTIISKLWTAIAASSASIIPLFSFNIYARLEKQERKPFGKNCECDEKAVQRRSLFFFFKPQQLSSFAYLKKFSAPALYPPWLLCLLCHLLSAFNFIWSSSLFCIFKSTASCRSTHLHPLKSFLLSLATLVHQIGLKWRVVFQTPLCRGGIPFTTSFLMEFILPVPNSST